MNSWKQKYSLSLVGLPPRCCLEIRHKIIHWVQVLRVTYYSTIIVYFESCLQNEKYLYRYITWDFICNGVMHVKKCSVSPVRTSALKRDVIDKEMEATCQTFLAKTCSSVWPDCWWTFLMKLRLYHEYFPRNIGYMQYFKFIVSLTKQNLYWKEY